MHLAIVIRGRDGPIAALTIYPVEHVFVIPSAVDRPVVPLWNSPDHLSVPVDNLSTARVVPCAHLHTLTFAADSISIASSMSSGGMQSRSVQSPPAPSL